MVVEQIRSGRPVAEVTADLGLSQRTVVRWVRQGRIDRVDLAGTSSAESAELRAATHRTAELEEELAAVEAASELFDKGRVVRPKELFVSWIPWPVKATDREESSHPRGGALAVLPVAVIATEPRAIRRAWLADVTTEIPAGRVPVTYGWRRIPGSSPMPTARR